MSRTGVEAKPTWQSLPSEVRQRAAQTLGAEVARAARVWGGYSPSPTFRLKLTNGQRAFFKGCGPDASAFLREVVMIEERVYTELAHVVSPWAPDLLGAFQTADWHVLLLEDVGPKTAPPWTPSLVQQTMRAYAEFHQSTLGTALPAWLPRFADTEARLTWQSITEATDGLREVAALAETHADDALRWFGAAEPLLTRLLASAPDISGPEALLHFDTRSDNLRLQHGRLRLFDWPAVMVGPIEMDVVAFAQSITVEGGPEPEQCITWYEGALRPEAVDIALAWAISFFATRAWLPDVPELPRLRRFQRQQLATLLTWAARRFSLPTPQWTAALAD